MYICFWSAAVGIEKYFGVLYKGSENSSRSFLMYVDGMNKIRIAVVIISQYSEFSIGL